MEIYYQAENETNLVHLSHLILEVGNNGCGPANTEELKEEIKKTTVIAKDLGTCIVISGYCGMKDLLVYPNGSFSVIETSHLKRYRLKG